MTPCLYIVLVLVGAVGVGLLQRSASRDMRALLALMMERREKP